MNINNDIPFKMRHNHKALVQCEGDLGELQGPSTTGDSCYCLTLKGHT